MVGRDEIQAEPVGDELNDPSSQASAERRQNARTMVHLAAAAREPGQAYVQVQIIDLSPSGCRIEMPCRSFGEQWILLTIPTLTSQYSRIVWQEQGFAGLEFTPPLNQSAFDALISRTRTTEQTILALRGVGDRARHMARRTIESPGKRALVDMSKDCFVAALVKTFQMTDVGASETKLGELSSKMIRRGAGHSPDGALP